jgi:hypothetical protein
MRLRPRTIRTQLVALLLVPLLSLAALWTYSTYTSVRGAIAYMRATATYRYHGTPADDLTDALQVERLAAVTYLASGGSGGTGDLTRDARITDSRFAVVRRHAARQAGGNRLDTRQRDRLDAVLRTADDLRALRADVRARRIGWSTALNRYSAVIEPVFLFRTLLVTGHTAGNGDDAGVGMDLDRSRELFSREDAVISAAQVGPPLTRDQYDFLIGDIAGRRLLDTVAAPELPEGIARRLRDFDGGHVAGQLSSMEEAAQQADGRTVGTVIARDDWRATADRALAELSAIDADAEHDHAAAVHRAGVHTLVRTSAVSLAGLLAVLLSVALSWRLGGRLTRRLTALRDTALDLSGRRLPDLLHRLRAGEEPDAALALLGPPPPEDSGDGPDGADPDGSGDEIVELGAAFDAAQRAAVRAAVEQERLRRGVSSVFTTLARRSQVLLHRQLSLLDTMERRTRDPAELQDLFRLDHMTTRMRRHAEGLLILSGNPPGRAWRRPVRLAEVVRAAVGEVEDYGRVTVRRMPRVDLAGAAVADVLHLVAELIENAAAFSPPDSRVVVRGRPIEDGYLLEITDRGLGMRPEPLAAANAEIVRAGTSAELPETDRLGLFTVGRLAARQGVTVRLRPGAKGGTVAEVRVPAAVLAPAADAPDEPETGEVELRPRVAAERVAAAAASGGPPVRGTADPAAAGEAGPDPARTAASAGRRRATGPVPAPEPPGGERTRAGLPKRARQASLVVRPREGAASGAGAPAEPPRRPDDPAHTPSPYGAGRERSPAEARSTMAAFARGLARGRAVGTNHDHDHDHATGESGERP